MRGSLETNMCKELNPQIKIADPYKGFLYHFLHTLRNEN